MKAKHTNYLITHLPEYYEPLKKKIAPEKLEYFDGSKLKSFSQLVNKCAAECPTETVIMTSYKAVPTAKDVQKTLTLLDEGFGFVGLYRFGFFGFRKELMRRIGPMDERFVGGGYEDNDFLLRMREADIAFFLSNEIKFNYSKSTWDHSKTRGIFYKKWGNIPLTGFVERHMPELKYDYDFGPETGEKYLKDKDTFIHKSNLDVWPEGVSHMNTRMF